MHRRTVALLASTVVVGAGLPLLAASPAEAIQAPVAFSSVAASTYQTNGIAWAVASAQGKVFVGGSFTSVRPAGSAAGTNETARSNFVTLDPATGAPTSCAPAFTLSGSASTATIRALDVSPDGNTLYIGGSFSSAGGKAKQYLAAMDIASCTIISAFTPLPNATVRAIKSTATAVYYGGDVLSVGGTARTYAAAAVAVGQSGAGSLLPWAPALDSNLRAINVKPDGSVVVLGGNFTTVNGAASKSLGVVDSSTGTTTVKAYGATFFGTSSVVKAIAVDATGFYLGNEGTGGGQFDGRTAINWSDYGQRWRDTCLGATQAVVLYQGVVYSGSHAHNCSSMGAYPDGARHHLLAQGVNDPTLLSWFPQTNDGLGESIGPRGMAVATNGTGTWMFVVGEFTTVNGVAQQSITRFASGVAGAPPSTPVMTVQSWEPGTVRVAWRPSQDNDDSTLTYALYRDGSTTPLWTGAVTSFFWTRPQQTYTDSGLAPGSTHTYKLTVTDGTTVVSTATTSVVVSSTGSAYASRILSDGPSVYLRWNESNNVLISDATANGANQVLSGVGTFRQPGAIAGDPSTSFTLTGTTSYMYGQKPVTGPLSAFSLETWFKTTSTVGGKIIGLGNKVDIVSSSYDKQIYMTNDGKLVFGVYNGATRTILTPTAYNDGQWHHVVATQNGSVGMVLYVDGVQVGTNSAKTNQGYVGYWRIGGDNLNSWPNQPTSLYWQGSLDETAIYPTALSSTTVSDHYTLGKGAPDTQAPTAPGTPSTTVNQGVSIGLSWAASTDNVGVTAYDVYRSATAGFTPSGAPLATVSTPSYNDTSAPIGQTSYYRVIARDAANNSSAPSGEASAFLTAPDVTAPSPVTDLAAIASGQSVGLTWTATTDDSGGAVTYRVYRSATSGFVPSAATLIGTSATAGYTDNAAPVGTSYYVVVAVDPSLNPSAPSNEASATVSAPADTTPPSQPSGLTATPAGTAVSLSWTASTDDTAVVGYDVYRSTTSGFTPSAGTLIGSSVSPSYNDAGPLAAGTYYYRVTARDAVPNVSNASAQATAVISSGSTPTVVTLTPTADTYGNAGATTTNYGTSSSLASRGTSGYATYMRFVLPAAPAGKTLTGATLKLTTSTDATAGTIDPQTISIASDAWVESTLTWANRPAVTGPTLGTLSGATAVSTAYTTTLTPAGLAALLGGNATISVTASGTDSFWFWSSNYSGAAARPTLTLTFS